MKNIGIFFLVAITVLSVGCSRDDNSAHHELANNFVNAVNMGNNNEFILIKPKTKQGNYVVVYDDVYKRYDAYDLTYYTAGMDVDTYFDLYSEDAHFGLQRRTETWITYSGRDNDIETHHSRNYYLDLSTGIEFSKTKMTSADTAKAQELIDGIKMEKATNKLTIEFGLAPSRAKEVASLALQISNNSSQMTIYQYDNYAKAILGTSISDINSAVDSYVRGNNKAIEEVYERAAVTNDISKSAVKKLAQEFILK